MNKKLITLIIVMAVAVMTGCAGIKTTEPVTVCNEFTGDSLIEKYIPNLRTANTFIKLSILEVSRLNSVKKKDIVKVLDEIDGMANSSTTYNQMFIYVSSKIEFIKKNMGPEIMIAGDDLIGFKDILTPISPKDICYIKYQIKEDRDKVLPWIPAK